MRSKKLLKASRYYFVAGWALVLGEFLSNQESQVTIFITYLTIVAAVVVSIVVLVRVVKWLGMIYDFSSEHAPAEIQMKRGWIFWGWVTPIVALWFPKKMIEQCENAVGSIDSSFQKSETGKWWGFYVASSILSWISIGVFLRGESSTGWRGESSAVWIDVIPMIFLTLAYPSWVKIIENLGGSVEKRIESLKA